MKPYSEDLGWRMERAVDRRLPREDVGWLFAVSPSTIKRWLRQRREAGDLAPK